MKKKQQASKKRTTIKKTTPSKQKKTFIDTYDLTVCPDTTRLVLIPKSPYWIYAYWDIAASALENQKQTSVKKREKQQLTLRIYDITMIDFNGHNANHYFDIAIEPETKNHYINLWRDDVSYCGEIGIQTAHGKFLPLVRSNSIHTPRAHHSQRREQIWMHVTDNTQKTPYIIATVQKEPPILSPRSQKQHTVKRKKIDLTEKDIKWYYSHLAPQMREVISSRLMDTVNKKAKKCSLTLEGEEREKQFDTSLTFSQDAAKTRVPGSSESFITPGASEYRTGI